MIRRVMLAGLLGLGVNACSGGGGSADQGDVCAYDEDCVEQCVTGLPGQSPYCTGSCDTESAQPCPAGYYCVVAGQAGRVCAMSSCTSDEECPQGYTCSLDESVCIHDPVECQSDTECPAGVACNQGVCQIRCEDDSGCKEGYLCQYHTRCVECLASTQCLGGSACSNGVCNQECISDASCREGHACTAHACAETVGGGTGQLGATCAVHTDCEFFCHDTVCARSCSGEADTTSCPSGYVCNMWSGLCEPG